MWPTGSLKRISGFGCECDACELRRLISPRNLANCRFSLRAFRPPRDNAGITQPGFDSPRTERDKESLAAFEKAIERGFGLELLPTSIVQCIDQSENRRDQDFQRLMKLFERNTPSPASQVSE